MVEVEVLDLFETGFFFSARPRGDIIKPMNLFKWSLQIVGLALVFGVHEPLPAQESESAQMEREVRDQVRARIRSYMHHLENEIKREEARRASRSQVLTKDAEREKAKEKIRREYLRNLPSEELAQEKRNHLRLEYEKNQEKQAERRKNSAEKYAQREQLLRAAQEKYDFLDPALEYGLTSE